MKIKTLLICWLPSFIVVFGLNGLFHSVLAASYFDNQLSSFRPPLKMMSEANPLWVALLDLMLVFAMTYFIAFRQGLKTNYVRAAFAGGLISLISSGAWNFANAAMFQGWPVSLTMVDMVWHIALGAVGGALISWLYNRFNK